MVSKHKRILISWVGGNDLKLDLNNLNAPGPILATLRTQTFDSVELLYNYPEKVVSPYIHRLESEFDIPIVSHHQALSSPINFAEIYKSANQLLSRFNAKECELCILLSPGTPAMQAVWILLGKTYYTVTFYQSSIEQGVQQVDIPFDINAEFIPALDNIISSKIINAPIDAAFDDIVTQNPEMISLKSRANVLAVHHHIPVLIYGETGTGKELFATAIHNASPRKNAAFVPVNCGAIPHELIDSILFGHTKGAFTGAVNDKLGLFQQADGGTIFLDEFGELPKEAQVRLLRVLQSGEVTPIGAKQSTKVDVRVITATNRDLIVEVAEGRFREDLFYRIAVGVLHLPPIRDRKGDIGLLIDTILKNINTEAKKNINLKEKTISVKGRNILLLHPWKGNVRELYATMTRAFLWSEHASISEYDIQAALLHMPSKEADILEKELSESFNIQDVISFVASHYIRRALDESHGSKTLAAEKLGLASYQTLKGWIKKYNVK